MKILEQNKAVELRRQGKTYSEILKEVPVSKSSLSYWLRNVALTPEQLTGIQYKNDKIKAKFVAFNEFKKKESEKNKSLINDNAGREINVISARELKLIGVALYWAEGHKRNARSADFVNTDPAMIKLIMRWFREVCDVNEKQFRIRLQVHNEIDIEKAKNYWSGITGVPIKQFTKVHTKISPISKRKVGNLAPYGICGIRVSNINLITKIQGWINGFVALSSSPV